MRRGVGGQRRRGLPGAFCPSPQVPPLASGRTLCTYRYTCRTYMWRVGVRRGVGGRGRPVSALLTLAPVSLCTRSSHRGEQGSWGAAAVPSPQGRLPFSTGPPFSHPSAHSGPIAIRAKHAFRGWGEKGGSRGLDRPVFPGPAALTPEVSPLSHACGGWDGKGGRGMRGGPFSPGLAAPLSRYPPSQEVSEKLPQG